MSQLQIIKKILAEGFLKEANFMQLVSMKDIIFAGCPNGPKCPKSCPLEKIGIVG